MRDLAVFCGMTVGSLLVHAATLGVLAREQRAPPRRSRALEVALVKPVKPAKPTVLPEVRPPAPPARRLPRSPAMKSTPARPPEAGPAPRPVFGLTLSAVGGTVAVPVGDTVTRPPVPKGAEAEPAKARVPSHELASLPKRQGPCEAAYPEAARALGVAGKVRLQLEIDALGHVEGVEVLDGPGHGLEEAAVAALRGCHFVPATRGGTAVATSITYTYTFVIDG